MKRILLALTIALGIVAQLSAQEETQITWGMVSTSINKSDLNAKHAKKSLKANTWVERARVYTRLYHFDLKGVMPGVDATQLTLMKQGEPTSKEDKNGVSVWKYERIDFYIKDNKVVKWEYPNALRPTPLLTSVEALKKAEELDAAGKLNAKIKERVTELSGYLKIAGSLAYGDEDFKKSLKYFQAITELNSLKAVNTIDTVLYNDCGVVAKLAGETDIAVDYFLKAADLGYKSEQLYGEASRLYLETKDTTKAIETLEKGIAKFSSANLISEMINIFLQTGKNEEALAYLDKAIAEDANNATYYFAKGALYDQISKSDDAVNAYKKAIEIDDKYVDAYLNLGASHYNKGIEHFKKANDTKSDKIYEQEKANAKEEYKKALPYLEKVVELNPEDKGTLKNAAYSLKNIYYKLGMNEESKKMKELYQSL